MSVQISKRKQIIFGIILTVIALGLIEAAANVWWYEVNTCAFEKSEIFKDMDAKTKRQLCLDFYNLQYTDTKIYPSTGKVHINNEGFRGPEITKEKPENTYRIFLVGGSTMFGSGNDDSTTISAYLQETMNNAQLDLDVEVINAGISGAWSETETKMVKERLINYEPDLIIVYDGANDLKYYSEGYENVWRDRWIEICNLGKENNFKTIITLQPFVGTGNRILTQHEHTFYLEADTLRSNHQFYPLFAKQLESLNKHCEKTVDLREMFDLIPSELFFDAVHVGNKGNRIVADNFYEISLPIIIGADIQSNISNKNQIESFVSYNRDDDIIEDGLFGFLSYYKAPRVLSHLIHNDFDGLAGSSKSIAHVNLKNANLEGKNFSEEDLSNAIFFKANLKDADFSNANLVGANFAGADLTNTNFEGANLSETYFVKTKLDNTNFKNTNLGNSWLANLDFTTSKILNASFKDSRILESNFKGMILSSTDFTGASLQYSDLSDTDLINVNLIDIDLTGSNLSGQNLSNKDLTGAILVNADLSYSNLENVDLSGKDLTGVNLIGVDLTDHDLTGTIFDDSDLMEAINVDNESIEYYGEPIKFDDPRDVPFLDRKLLFLPLLAPQFQDLLDRPEDINPSYHLTYTLLDNHDLYGEIGLFDEPKNAVVIYPSFTQAAYNEPAFYTYYPDQIEEFNHTTDLDEHDEIHASWHTSSIATQVLSLLKYEIITDEYVDIDPNILSNYDKVILLHNEFVTQKEFDAITNHPKVIYLYPNALYAEIEVNYKDRTITRTHPHHFPDERIRNDFDWKYDNTRNEYVQECQGEMFEKIDNGIMLHCYPELAMLQSSNLLKMIKEF